MRSSDRGSVTIWMLGLSMLLLVVGGLALDYWRALGIQRELAAVADSAAISAASGIDEAVYRTTGRVVLDRPRAVALARQSVEWQGVDVTDVDVDVASDVVTVTLSAEVEIGLLGVFVDQGQPFIVRAVAKALPVLTP